MQYTTENHNNASLNDEQWDRVGWIPYYGITMLENTLIRCTCGARARRQNCRHRRCACRRRSHCNACHRSLKICREYPQISKYGVLKRRNLKHPESPQVQVGHHLGSKEYYRNAANENKHKER